MEKTIVTTCALDCPDNCGMLAEVKDGRIIRLKGNPEHGHTKGFLCQKGYKYLNRVYSSNRILSPLKRSNDGWKRISWDEALNTIAEKIRFFLEVYGNGSIMHFQRSASWGASKHLVRRLFNLMGGVTGTKGSLCAGSVMAAQQSDMGARLGNDPEDILNSRVIIIWGRDPAKSSIHYLPTLKRAHQKGARLILIDPVRTKTASICDEHIAPYPGSDGHLAIGMAKKILEMGLIDSSFVKDYALGYEKYVSLVSSFSMKEISERCRLEPKEIERLALTYAENKPASILLGYGINKWVRSPEMIRLIDALGAITGNIGRSGGGINHGFQTRRLFDLKVLAPEAARYRREIPEPVLAQGILDAADPSIRMIWINGSNPVVSCPNSYKVIRALKSLDFIVVVDHFMTDTADLAHIFLPTTTFLEEEDIVVSWGHNWIGPVNEVIEPLGECKSDFHIMQELARRLGLGNEMAGSTCEWLKRLLQPMEKAGIHLEQAMQSPKRCPLAPMVAFSDRKFLTPSGKFEFIDTFFEEGEGKYPYHLLTVLGEKWLNSLILEEEHPKIPQAFISPNLAGEKGIANKSKTLIKSSVGELVAEANFSNDVPEDTLVLPHGTWVKRGGAANQLTEDLLSSSGYMAAYYSTTISVEPSED